MVVTSQAALLAVCVVSALSVGSLDISRLARMGNLLLVLGLYSQERPGGWRTGGSNNRLPLNSLDFSLQLPPWSLASAPGLGDDVLDKGVENDGVAHREVSKYPLDATTIALKIAL